MIFPVFVPKCGIQHAVKQSRESTPLKLQLKPHKRDTKQKHLEKKALQNCIKIIIPLTSEFKGMDYPFSSPHADSKEFYFPLCN